MFTVVRIVQKVECMVADLFLVAVVVFELLKFRMHMFPLMIQMLDVLIFAEGL